MIKKFSFVFLFILFCGNCFAGGFQTTVIQDDFNRSNEGPPMTGWSTILGDGWEVLSNQAVVDATTNGFAVTYYALSATTAVDWEVYATIVDKGLNGEEFDLSGVDSSSNGYGLVLYPVAGTDTVEIIRNDSGPGTGLSTVSQEITNGDGLGIRRIGNDIYLWYRSGASGIWSVIDSHTDSTYTTGIDSISMVGVTSDLSLTIDDVGAGSYKPRRAIF